MDWQASGDWQGGTPGRPADLPALLAAFEHGGAWESVTAQAELARVDDSHRSHLHPGTLAIHRLAAALRGRIRP